ncbi:outer membrane lipoprotein-sorting protein [bacterium]|nr:outer membrane lipoprotein-sorting protein [bacterium]
MKSKLVLLFSLGFLSLKSDLTADQIVQKSEANLRAATVIANINVKIERPRWDKEMSLKAWVKGTDYAAAYVLAPSSDEGTVFLKNQDEVWNYLPKIKKTIKMPMSMLSQNWMGTDLTNDDLINGSVFSEDYKATLNGTLAFGGKTCYNISLSPKDEASSIWSRIDLLIDKTNYIQMRAQFYDEDLDLVHSIIGSDIKSMGGRMLASKYVMIPEGKDGYKTTMRYEKMIFDQSIPSSFFSKENIAKIQP